MTIVPVTEEVPAGGEVDTQLGCSDRHHQALELPFKR